MNPGEPSRERPYRSPSPTPDAKGDTTFHEPVENHLKSFAEHEKCLAVLDIYRQTIATCRTQKAIDALKQECRDALRVRFPPVENEKSTDREFIELREGARRGSIWLQKLTLDEAALFAPPAPQKEPSKLSMPSLRSEALVVAVLAIAALADAVWRIWR